MGNSLNRQPQRVWDAPSLVHSRNSIHPKCLVLCPTMLWWPWLQDKHGLHLWLKQTNTTHNAVLLWSIGLRATAVHANVYMLLYSGDAIQRSYNRRLSNHMIQTIFPVWHKNGVKYQSWRRAWKSLRRKNSKRTLRLDLPRTLQVTTFKVRVLDKVWLAAHVHFLGPSPPSVVREVKEQPVRLLRCNGKQLNTIRPQVLFLQK